MTRSRAFDRLSRIWILAPGLALSACASAPAGAPAPSEAGQPFALKYLCGNRDVTVGFVGDRPQMRAGGGSFELRQVPAASGAKFEADGDPTTIFWSKASKATVTVRGEVLPECRTVAIGSQTLRASGNEPGWRLEAYGPNLRFETADGGIRLSRRFGPPAVSDGTTTYTAPAAGGLLTAVVRDRSCTDTMSGMPYPKSVRVVYRGKVFDGCGGDPASLLHGGEWVVEDIASAGIIDRSRVTVGFGADGRVSGQASCNRYTGEYELTGEGLRIARAAVTKRACAAALMRQEQRFLAVLAAVQRFGFTADGALVLIASDGRRVVARRATSAEGL